MKLLSHIFVFVFLSSSVYAKMSKALEQSYATAIKKCADASFEIRCREIFEQLFNAHKYDQAYVETGA